MFSFPNRHESGFTLLELVTVIAIIGILVAVTMGIFDEVRERSIRSRTESEIASLRTAIDAYRVEFGSFPVVENGDNERRSERLFLALLGKNDPDGNVVSNRRSLLRLEDYDISNDGRYLIDGWGTPIYYGYSETWEHGHYFLFSNGPDGAAELPDAMGHYEAESQSNLDNIEGRNGL